VQDSAQDIGLQLLAAAARGVAAREGWKLRGPADLQGTEHQDGYERGHLE